MDMIANKRFRYRGRALRKGDPFTPSRQHARVLAATGLAQQAELGTVTAPAPRTISKRLRGLDRDRDGAAGGSLAANPPSLRGKSKARLLEIAKLERVAIPDPEASNSIITGLIEAKRQGRT